MTSARQIGRSSPRAERAGSSVRTHRWRVHRGVLRMRVCRHGLRCIARQRRGPERRGALHWRAKARRRSAQRVLKCASYVVPSAPCTRWSTARNVFIACRSARRRAGKWLLLVRNGVVLRISDPTCALTARGCARVRACCRSALRVGLVTGLRPTSASTPASIRFLPFALTTWNRQ